MNVLCGWLVNGGRSGRRFLKIPKRDKKKKELGNDFEYSLNF